MELGQACIPGVEVPDDVLRFWREAAWARLFEDATYGQWGLEILAPGAARAETERQQLARKREFIQGDLVLGRFLGDSDLLIVRSDKAQSDFGRVLVALPLDPRRDWCPVASSFEDFLSKYASAFGDKYWEVAEQSH
jgi:hypothetical protein